MWWVVGGPLGGGEIGSNYYLLEASINITHGTYLS